MGYELSIYVGEQTTVSSTFIEDGGEWRNCYDYTNKRPEQKELGNKVYKWYEANGETCHEVVTKEPNLKEAMYLGTQHKFELGKVLDEHAVKLSALVNSRDEAFPQYYIYYGNECKIDDPYGDLLPAHTIKKTIDALQEMIDASPHDWWPEKGCLAALKEYHKTRPDLICVFYGH